MKDLATLAPARERAYAFLSSAYAEPPSLEVLGAIRDEGFVGLAAELFGERALVPIREFAARPVDAVTLQAEARQAFMNLFKVPGAQYVTPYESVYRDAHEVAGEPTMGLLMGQSAIDVQKWYRLAAVEISDEYKDLPDHICLELNYLAHLCGKEQAFAAAGDQPMLTRAWEMQRDFLASHVVSWVRGLRDKIYEKSQHPYYRAVADMTVEFAQRDLATLEDVLGRSEGNPEPA